MESFERFIIENEGADTVRLVMSRREWPVPGDPGLAGLNAKSLAVNTIEGRKRLRKKLPEWVACTGVVYPSSLCAEQCSSSDTARYKASVIHRILYEYDFSGASTGSATEQPDSAIENKLVTEPVEVTAEARTNPIAEPAEVTAEARNNPVAEPAEVTTETRTNPVAEPVEVTAEARNNPVTEPVEVTEEARNNPVH